MEMGNTIIDKNIPRLQGKRTYLSLLRNDNEAIQKYMAWMSDETTCAFIEKNMEIVDYTMMPGWICDNRVLRMGIVYKENDELIGYCHIDYRSKQSVCWISINIGDASYRGKGIGSDVLDTMMDYSFKELNVESMHLDVLEDNQGAIRLYETKGFIISGRYRAHGFHNGHRCDWLHMDILKDEYFGGR